MINRVDFLKGVGIFKGLDTDSLNRIAAVMEEQEFETGGVVFDEKGTADALYIILDGGVDIFAKGSGGKDILIGKLIREEFFGQLSLIGNFEHLVKAVSQQNTTLLKLPRSKFVEMNKTNPQLSLRIVLNIFSDFLKSIQDNRDAFKYIIEYYIQSKEDFK
jgi:CRP-like cAMP-binding protein